MSYFSHILVILIILLNFKELYARKNPNIDKSINLFSPEGDLLQVGYAELASEKGSTVVCLPTSDDGIVICIESNPDFDILLDRRSADKLSKIDDNIWLTFSGLVGDGRSIVRSARSFCSSHHKIYGCSPSVSAVANHLGDIQHEATFSGGELSLIDECPISNLECDYSGQRPLGVHALVCGFDEDGSKPRIFSVRASGKIRRLYRP
jgi:20S proteasome alpha/beta subunit